MKKGNEVNISILCFKRPPFCHALSLVPVATSLEATLKLASDLL